MGSVDFGKFDENYYFHTTGSFHGGVLLYSSANEVIYDLNRWRQITGQDQNSIDVGTYYRYTHFSVKSVGDNLIANPTFDANISKWTRWSSGGATAISWSKEGGLDGGCLKTVNTDPSGADGQTISSGFSLIKDSTYYLSVDMTAPVPTTIRLVVRQNASPYEIYASRYVTVTPERKTYTLYFTSAKDVANARFNTHFNGPGEFYMDNVVFAQAEVKVNEPANAAKILINDQAVKKDFSLGVISYCDITGKKVEGSVTLEPYSSMVLLPSYNNEDGELNNLETHETAPGDWSATVKPIVIPTVAPTVAPTATPTIKPTVAPTVTPAAAPDAPTPETFIESERPEFQFINSTGYNYYLCKSWNYEKDYNPNRKYPLIVYLHGNNTSNKTVYPPSFLGYGPSANAKAFMTTYPCFVYFPTTSNLGWNETPSPTPLPISGAFFLTQVHIARCDNVIITKNDLCISICDKVTVKM